MAIVFYFLLLCSIEFHDALTLRNLSADIWNDIADDLDGSGSGITKSSKSTPSPIHNSKSMNGIESIANDCECVPFYQCQNGTIQLRGGDLLDIRIRENDNPCQIGETCCRLKKIRPNEPMMKSPRKTTPTKCGVRRTRNHPTKHVDDDTDNTSQVGEFPWTIAIIPERQLLKVVPEPRCGGALIHPRVVLTAAHCFSNQSDSFVARAGEWDISREVEYYLHEDVAVASIQVHPRFQPLVPRNDIALLFLNTSLRIFSDVDLICLPSQNQQPPRAGCIATGWGMKSLAQPTFPHRILKKLHLPVVPNQVCQRSLRRTRLGSSFRLSESFMCAGGEAGRDTCRGDGGSPLACPMEGGQGRYYLAGLVSWGVGCGEEGVPGVYVNVALFRDWIDQQMHAFGLDGFEN